MTPEAENNLRLEIGHVLFIDLVGYSKLLIEEQKGWLRQLTDIVLATTQVIKSSNEQLVRLPTGDGMALVFRNSAQGLPKLGLLDHVAGNRRFAVRQQIALGVGAFF